MIFVDIFYQGPDFIISGYEGDYSLENGKVCKVEKWMADILMVKGYAKTAAQVFGFKGHKRGEKQCA